MFHVPINRHQWFQTWYAGVINILASRKLGWETPKERLTGNTLEISVFRLHIWEPIRYFDPNAKIPSDRWLNARWLGILWSAGDELTYHIETGKPNGESKDVVSTRSVIHLQP